MHPLSHLASALAFVAGSALAAPELRTTLEDQTAVALTIYNDNLALVKDRREVPLQRGSNQLAFRQVSSQLRAETALLRSVDASEALRILEQNFDFDLLTPQKLLEKSVGKEVRIARLNPATGEETIERATVLSSNNGVVLQIGERIETNPRGRFIFDALPPNLRDVPTLSMLLDSPTGGRQEVELSYLTGGLGWKADYVAELNADDSALDLMGWVTLSNTSGTSYREAQLQLVAGDVNQVRDDLRQRQMMREEMAMAAAADAGMREESLFEYHLYTLDRATTIADRQTKQVSLLSGQDIAATRELVLQGSPFYYQGSHGSLGKKLKLGVFLQFDNRREDGLGIPLPKGVVRVYKRDASGNAQFIGEDRIDHTPNRAPVRLRLGDSFDVTADRTQTDFRILDKLIGRDRYESRYEITLYNGGDEPARVIVREPIPGDWEMVEASHPHDKVAANTAEWRLEVPAEGSTVLSYTTRVTF